MDLLLNRFIHGLIELTVVFFSFDFLLVFFWSPYVVDSLSVVQVFKGKAWKNPKKFLTMPIVLQKQYHFRQHSGGNNERFASLYWRGKNKFLLNAASEQPLESEPSKKLPKSLQDGLDAFYRFSRPHTVIGTVKFQLQFYWFIWFTQTQNIS